MDIIAILTLIIALCTLVFSVHIYNQTYLIPKKSESIQNLINIITDKIYELKVEKEEFGGNRNTIEYFIYTNPRENGCIDIYEKWKRILEDFRYSSDYNFLITPARSVFDEIFSKDFYTQLKSPQDLVMELEAKREFLLKLHETIFKNLVDSILIRLLKKFS